MKKALSLLTALFAMGTLMAQTPSIVSTSVEKRNVLIEEFTGVGCGYCPDGHARANTICKQYEGHAWAINIHAGGYATGSGYTTDFGDGIHNEFLSEIQGYPCGTVNRGSIQDRTQWAATAASVREEDSPINVAATASIDPMTRLLTVEVEVYCTDDQDVSSNYLNVALVQNNILGPQSNYGNYNPDYIEGNLYRHMHMFRHLLTGQWGESVSTTKSNFETKTYTYTLPGSIGIVPISDFGDLEVICFLTEDHRNVITACEAEMTILPAGYISGFSVENEDCSFDFTPVVHLSNSYSTSITSWTIEYNGTEYTFDKTVAAGTSDTVHLPVYTVTVGDDAYTHVNATATLSIISYVNDDETVEALENTFVGTIADMEIYSAEGPLYLGLGLDHYGSDTKAYLIDQTNCSPVWTSPKFSDRTAQALMPTRWNFFTLSPTSAGLYLLKVTDEYGDGMDPNYTSDHDTGIKLFSLANEGDTTAIFSKGGDFGSEFSVWINVTNAGDGNYEGVEEASEVSFSIYPNPVHGQLNISASEPVRMVEVIDMTGRTVMTLGANSNKVNTENLLNGIYVVRVTTESGIGMQKFVKE